MATRPNPAAYPHAEIVTNQITREAMVRKGLKRIQDHVRQAPAEVAHLEKALAAARGPEERAKLDADVRLAWGARTPRATCSCTCRRRRSSSPATP